MLWCTRMKFPTQRGSVTMASRAIPGQGLTSPESSHRGDFHEVIFARMAAGVPRQWCDICICQVQQFVPHGVHKA